MPRCPPIRIQNGALSIVVPCRSAPRGYQIILSERRAKFQGDRRPWLSEIAATRKNPFGSSTCDCARVEPRACKEPIILADEGPSQCSHLPLAEQMEAARHRAKSKPPSRRALSPAMHLRSSQTGEARTAVLPGPEPISDRLTLAGCFWPQT